jgi:hypothetical protein
MAIQGAPCIVKRAILNGDLDQLPEETQQAIISLAFEQSERFNTGLIQEKTGTYVDLDETTSRSLSRERELVAINFRDPKKSLKEVLREL